LNWARRKERRSENGGGATSFGDVTEQYNLYRRKRLLSQSETIAAQRHMIQLDEMHSALPMLDLGSRVAQNEEERRRFSWSRLRRERGGGKEEEGGEGGLSLLRHPLSKMTDCLAFTTPLSNELHPPPLPWRRPTCNPRRGEDAASFFDTLTSL